MLANTCKIFSCFHQNATYWKYSHNEAKHVKIPVRLHRRIKKLKVVRR